MAYFENQNSGELLAILNDDINQLERFFNVGINDIVQFTTTIVTIGGMYIILAPTICWYVLLPMPFVFIGSMIFQRALLNRYAIVREAVSTINITLANNIAGISSIKSYATEDYESKQVNLVSDQYRNSNFNAIKVSAAFIPTIRMIIVLGFAGIMLNAGFLALNNSINIGLYSILIFMSQRILWPLTRLGDTIDLYQRAKASNDRVEKILQIKPPISSTSTTHSRIDPNIYTKDIRFDNVSFSYDNGMKVIKNLSLTIPAGKTTAFVGLTGAGKSTVVKLLLRFYEPSSGAIYLDETNITDIDLRSLRSNIGYVPQETFLFQGTIKDNI
jgi:ATP-binding cassette subfamily B protein